MEHRIERNYNKPRTLREIEPGAFFTLADGFVRLATDEGYVTLVDGLHYAQTSPSIDFGKIRNDITLLRLDRVEDGVTVYVEAWRFAPGTLRAPKA